MTNEKFTRLVMKYTDTVFRVALNIVKSPSAAEDVCQEVFLRLWKNKNDFADDQDVKYWLIRVAINESRRSIVSKWNKYENLDDYAEKLSFQTTEMSDLFYSVMNLPRKYRIVIYLYYYEGYSSAEISKLLSSTEAAVRTQLHRGRELLKKDFLEAKNV